MRSCHWPRARPCRGGCRLSETGAFAAPWFAPVRASLDAVGGYALAGRWDECMVWLNERARERGLRTGDGEPLRFVDSRLIDAPAYEQHICATGQVPTRLHGPGAWHDFLNATVWLAFPRTKARLNRLQAQAIEADGIGARRGGVRDAATLFDENAVLFVCAHPQPARCLREFDWAGLFVDGRDAFDGSVRVVGFGHALLDKLRAPYKGVCAHAWVIESAPAGALDWSWTDPLPRECADRIDALTSEHLDAHALQPCAFSPLPVLGIPGWWADNSVPGFYDDTSVFRAGRGRRERSDKANPGLAGPDSRRTKP